MAEERKTRVYAVVSKTTGKVVRYVEASNNVQVFSHVARAEFDVTPATQRQMLDAGKAGVDVELAKADAAHPELELVGGGKAA